MQIASYQERRDGPVPAPASGGGLTIPSPVLMEGRHWNLSRSAIVTVLSVSMAVAARSTLACQLPHQSSSCAGCGERLTGARRRRRVARLPSWLPSSWALAHEQEHKSFAVVRSMHPTGSQSPLSWVRCSPLGTHRSTQRHQRHPSVSPGKPGRREERSLPEF